MRALCGVLAVVLSVPSAVPADSAPGEAAAEPADRPRFGIKAGALRVGYGESASGGTERVSGRNSPWGVYGEVSYRGPLAGGSRWGIGFDAATGYLHRAVMNLYHPDGSVAVDASGGGAMLAWGGTTIRWRVGGASGVFVGGGLRAIMPGNTIVITEGQYRHDSDPVWLTVFGRAGVEAFLGRNLSVEAEVQTGAHASDDGAGYSLDVDYDPSLSVGVRYSF